MSEPLPPICAVLGHPGHVTSVLDAAAQAGFHPQVLSASGASDALATNLRVLQSCTVVAIALDVECADAAFALGYACLLGKTLVGLKTRQPPAPLMVSETTVIVTDRYALTELLSKLFPRRRAS